MGGYAWVTLATNNSYSLGALVLAHSLKKSNTAHKLVVLITSAVSESMRNQLNTVFDVVKLVDVLDSKDEAHLALMQRPELGITFTKIHCWRLTEFEKCVFLDADTIVVRNCDELFEREEFSAAPDASWPDCFNSGVFVFRPSVDTFNKILQFAVENKSFDGGDQGLLNQFFSSWATEDIKKHLPFVYNLTSIGSYAYIPAFKHYGAETRIVHFIGTGKPWLQQLDIATRTVTPSSGYEHLAPLLQQWWDLFCEKVHPNLDKNLESSNEGMSHSPVEACSNSLPIALTDEPQTLRLIPCTPHRENVATKQHEFPFKTNNSSGESKSPCMSVSPSRTITPVFVPRSECETRSTESPNCREFLSRIQTTPEKKDEYNRRIDASVEVREGDKEEKKEQQPQEEPPPKDPFDYESFFPDENCIQNYLEQNVVTYQPFESQEEVKLPKEPEPLPRFLTIPESDLRQSGNFDPPVEKHEPQTQPPTEKAETPIKKEHPPQKETLTKSKSMPFLPLEVSPEPPRSIWKSQPNVNVDPNKKYSMPKLKPILPRQNSKYVRTKIPKVTHYTEFLMSSDYKDPVNLPKDRIGFVATQLHTQKHKRNKSNVRSKFGPLPFIPSPETENPSRKKIRLEHSDDDLYDLTQCKRQSGNKPKQKDVQKKQNGNNLEEILKRLKEFSKDYQHYFGIVPKPRKKTVMCKNAIVQVGGEGECRMSEAYKTVRTAVCSWSRGTQTHSQREGFRLFRSYVKDQNEACQKGLLMISGGTKAKTKFGVGTTPKGDVSPVKNKAVGVNFEKFRSRKAGSKSPSNSKNHFSPNASLKLQSPESRVDGVSVESPKLSSTNYKTEEPILHSKNESKSVGEESKHDDVTVTTNTEDVSLKFSKDISTESSEKRVDGVSVESPKLSRTNYETEEPILHSKNESKLVGEESKHDDVTVTKSIEDVSLKFSQSEPLVHSNSSLAEDESQGTADVTITQSDGVLEQSELSGKDVSEESSKVQILPLEKEEKVVVPSKNLPELAVEDKRDGAGREAESNGDSTVLQATELSKNELESSRNEEEPIAHSENQLNLGVEENENQEKEVVVDDVIANRLQKSAESNESTTANCLHTRTEEESAVRSDNQSRVVIEEKQLENCGDDVTEGKLNGVSLKLQHSDSFTDGEIESTAVEIQHSKNEEEPVADVERHLNDDVPNGIPSAISGKPEETANNITKDTHFEPQRLIKSTSVSEQNQLSNFTDDVIKFQNNGVLDKSEVRENSNLTTELIKADTQPENSLEVTEQNQTPNDDVTGSYQPPALTQVTSSPKSSPAVTLEQNGHPSEQMVIEEKVKKPEEILCVPDFETPRSSRVTLKTTEEEITMQKSRKCRASPKKVRERFSNDSPDESVRFDGKKNTPEENSEPERPDELKDTSGIAGAIAQLSLQAGSEQTPESTSASAAHQEYLRRQNWETGNIDYMGRDSFDNIWSKICQTLEAKEEPPTTTGDVKKPSDPSSNVPEFIETLPGKPAPGPVEDDECIFSKSDSRQSGLMNISEEEETGGQGVKLSDILGPAKSGVKPVVPEAKSQSLVSSSDGKSSAVDVKLQSGEKAQPPAVGVMPQSAAVEVKSQLPAAEVKSQPAVEEAKPQPPAAEVKPQSAAPEAKTKPPAVEVKTEVKPQPAAEVKPQPVASEAKTKPPAPEVKTEVKPQPAVAEVKPQPAASEAKPQPPAAEVKQEVKPQSPAAEVKPEVKSQPLSTEAKPAPADAETKSQPSGTEIKSQPSATETKPQVPTTEVKSQPELAEAKPQPPTAESKPQPAASEAKPQPQAATEVKPEMKPQSLSTETKPQLGTADTKSQPPTAPIEVTPQPSLPGTTDKPTTPQPTGECKVVALPSPPILPPETHPKGKKPVERSQVHAEPIPLPPPDSPSSEQPPKPSDSSKDDGKQKKGVFTKILEMVGVKEKNGSEGTKSVFYDLEAGGKEGETIQPEVKEAPKVEMKEAETVQPTPAPEKTPTDPQNSIQVSDTKRKSPSPKLAMPQTPETAVTTPTPPPNQEIPPRKNSALLKVDETILETPPVPEPSNIQTEIEDIIGKAKTEVETLLQDRAEKETTDVVNTMKLLMGEEQEEVEELKVTTEEERKRHKGEVVSSKLSDQILKAIPPPRRKAISDATASTSAIPKATPEQKSPQTAEGKTKSSKPSSIPVPPPRNKGKPQPPPTKGKGKK